MKGLDTIVIVRFLVNDDAAQAAAARKLLLDAEKKGEGVFMPLSVTLETIWVLDSVYGYSRQDIILALENLLVLSVLEMEAHERIASLCRLAAVNDSDLADLLIGLTARDNGCETTLTFDKKTARSDLFMLIR